jgi:hypothetical protein
MLLPDFNLLYLILILFYFIYRYAQTYLNFYWKISASSLTVSSMKELHWAKSCFRSQITTIGGLR